MGIKQDRFNAMQTRLDELIDSGHAPEDIYKAMNHLNISLKYITNIHAKRTRDNGINTTKTKST